MPTLNCNRDRLFKLIGRTYTEEEFDRVCFEFGVELDEVTSERKMAENELGDDADKKEVAKKLEGLSDDEIYKIDLPANRYDLLSIEHFAIALRVFLGDIQPPKYQLVGEEHVMKVSSSVSGVRPFVVCAVLKNLTFDKDSYASFIDLQERLHQNLARKRTLVSVGTHDMDTIQGPYRYDAVPRKDISFVPLSKDVEVKGEDFVDFYRKDLRLSKYLHMIENEPNFPLIRDANGTIMSLPPIINSRHSQITLNTKNVFIEATAMDEHKAIIMVNQILAAFSYYCKDQFTVEPVRVEYEDGRTVVTPDLSSREIVCSVEKINTQIGIDLSAEDMASSLTKMLLTAEAKDANTIQVWIPPTRSDVLHTCDVMEDVAIAYGYDNLKKKAPTTLSVARQDPLMKISHMLRLEFAQAGYNEVLTLSLASLDESYKFMRKEDPGSEAVKIANPQTLSFQMCRVSLLPGLLKCIYMAKVNPLPLKLFEVTDILHKDSSVDVGCSNKRHAAAIYSGNTSGLENIHGLVDHILAMLGVPLQSDATPDGYYIKPSEDPSFFPGRQAEVFMKKTQKVGVFGILHPEVLKAFEIPFSCSAMEIDIEAAMA